MRNNSRIILALDVRAEKKALELARELADVIACIKVGYPLVLSCGFSVVSELAALGPVICDFKVADVPHTNRAIAQKAAEIGAEGLIVHGFIGGHALRELVALEKLDIYVVAELTSPGAAEFFDVCSARIARLAADVGARGLIAPGNKPEKLRRFRELAPELLILAPGIGVQGGSAREAIRAGADYVIVGRSIYRAQNPRRAAAALADLCAATYQERTAKNLST